VERSPLEGKDFSFEYDWRLSRILAIESIRDRGRRVDTGQQAKQYWAEEETKKQESYHNHKGKGHNTTRPKS